MSHSIEQTAKYLSISQKQVYQLLKNGQLKVKRINGRAIVNQGTLLAYMARKRPFQ